MVLLGIELLAASRATNPCSLTKLGIYVKKDWLHRSTASLSAVICFNNHLKGATALCKRAKQPPLEPPA